MYIGLCYWFKIKWVLKTQEMLPVLLVFHSYWNQIAHHGPLICCCPILLEFFYGSLCLGGMNIFRLLCQMLCPHWNPVGGPTRILLSCENYVVGLIFFLIFLCDVMLCYVIYFFHFSLEIEIVSLV